MKKSNLAISCAALAITLTLSSYTAFAQNSSNIGNSLNNYNKKETLSNVSTKNATPTNSSPIIVFSESNNQNNSHNLLIPDEESNISIRQNNNVTEYSTDNGKTWSREKPENFYDFNFTVNEINGSLLREGEAFSFNVDNETILMKKENNIVKYSLDNGDNWLTELPEKYKNKLNNFPNATINLDKTIIGDEQGFFTFDVDNNNFQVRFDNGKIEYSIDGGKTWSTEKPETLNDLSMDIKVEVFNADSDNKNESFKLIPDTSDI